MGAPIGNRNGAKGKEWEMAIRKALHQREGSLGRIALKVVDSAEAGDQWAINHIADRLDGKPAQTVDASLTVSDYRNLSDADLDRLIAAELARRAQETASDTSVTH